MAEMMPSDMARINSIENPLTCIQCKTCNQHIVILECFHVLCEKCYLKNSNKKFLILCPICSQITSLPINDSLKSLASNLSLVQDSIQDTVNEDCPIIDQNLLELKKEMDKLNSEKSKNEEEIFQIQSKQEEQKREINLEFEHKFKILEQERESKIQNLDATTNLEKEDAAKNLDAIAKNLAKLNQHHAFTQMCREKLSEDELKNYSNLLKPPKVIPLRPSKQSIIVEEKSKNEAKMDEKLQFTQSLAINFIKEKPIAKQQLQVANKRDYQSIKEPVLSFGKYGNGISEFRTPKEMIVDDENDRIIILDQFQVKIFSLQGLFLIHFGERGTNKGEFSDPTSICLFQDRIYISDSGFHCIHVFELRNSLETDYAIHYISSFGHKGTIKDRLKNPGTILQLKNKAMLLIADNGNNSVVAYNAGHQYIYDVIKNNSGYIYGMCMSWDNKQLYVLERANKCIRVFSFEGGNLIKEFGMLNNELKCPWSIGIDSYNNVLVVDGLPVYGTFGHSVKIFKPDGKVLCRLGDSGKGLGQFKDPRAVKIGSNGLMYILDSGNHRVQIF